MLMHIYVIAFDRRMPKQMLTLCEMYMSPSLIGIVIQHFSFKNALENIYKSSAIV